MLQLLSRRHPPGLLNRVVILILLATFMLSSKEPSPNSAYYGRNARKGDVIFTNGGTDIDGKIVILIDRAPVDLEQQYEEMIRVASNFIPDINDPSPLLRSHDPSFWGSHERIRGAVLWLWAKGVGFLSRAPVCARTHGSEDETAEPIESDKLPPTPSLEAAQVTLPTPTPVPPEAIGIEPEEPSKVSPHVIPTSSSALPRRVRAHREIWRKIALLCSVFIARWLFQSWQLEVSWLVPSVISVLSLATVLTVWGFSRLAVALGPILNNSIRHLRSRLAVRRSNHLPFSLVSRAASLAFSSMLHWNTVSILKPTIRSCVLLYQLVSVARWLDSYRESTLSSPDDSDIVLDYANYQLGGAECVPEVVVRNGYSDALDKDIVAAQCGLPSEQSSNIRLGAEEHQHQSEGHQSPAPVNGQTLSLHDQEVTDTAALGAIEKDDGAGSFQLAATAELEAPQTFSLTAILSLSVLEIEHAKHLEKVRNRYEGELERERAGRKQEVSELCSRIERMAGVLSTLQGVLTSLLEGRDQFHLAQAQGAEESSKDPSLPLAATGESVLEMPATEPPQPGQIPTSENSIPQPRPPSLLPRDAASQLSPFPHTRPPPDVGAGQPIPTVASRSYIRRGPSAPRGSEAQNHQQAQQYAPPPIINGAQIGPPFTYAPLPVIHHAGAHPFPPTPRTVFPPPTHMGGGVPTPAFFTHGWTGNPAGGYAYGSPGNTYDGRGGSWRN